MVDGRRRARTLFLTAPTVARATLAVLPVGHAVVSAAVVPRLARRLRAR